MALFRCGGDSGGGSTIQCYYYMTSTTVILKKNDVVGQGYISSPNAPISGTVNRIISDILIGSGNMAIDQVTSDTCTINIGGTGSWVVSDQEPQVV